MAVGDKVNASDFNGVRDLSVRIIGTGSGQRGYGQVTSGNSAQVVGEIITPGDYNSLRNNLYNARAHQIGSAPAIAEVASQYATIVDTDFSAFANYADLCDTNRFSADGTRVTTASVGSRTRSTSWRVSVSINLTVTFSSPDVARFFFNAGGNISFVSSRSGGAASSQNTSWTNLLNTAGTRTYDYTNFYAATSSTTNLYTATASSPYANNRYTITNSCNVASNANGGATTLTFGFTWADLYNDPSPGNPPLPEDIVDGTLSLDASIRHPIGGAVLSGGGVWVGFNTNGTGGFYSFPSFTWSSTSITGS